MNSRFDINVNNDYINKANEYKKKPNKYILEDLYNIRDLIDLNNIDILDNNLYQKGKILEKKFELRSIKKLILFKHTAKKNKKYHLYLTKKRKIIKTKDIKGINNNIEVPIEKNIDFAINFMKQYKPEFYQVFKELYENNHIKFTNPIDNNTGGVTYRLNDGLPYVIIYTKNRIYDAGCLIHEIGHCYHIKKSMNNKSNKPDFYTEVYSNYVQLLFYEYMQNDEILKNDIKKLKENHLNKLRCCLARLNNYIKDSKFRDSTYGDFQYGYGIALALYYYNMHLQYPSLTEHFLDWFVSSSQLFNQEDVLEKYAIDKDKILTKDIINNFMK